MLFRPVFLATIAFMAAQPIAATGFIAGPANLDPWNDIAIQAVTLDAATDSDILAKQDGLSTMSLAEQLAGYTVRTVQDAPDIRQQIGVKSDFSARKS